MVVVPRWWLTALVSSQCVLFLHNETYDKVVKEGLLVLYKINKNKVLHLL